MAHGLAEHVGDLRRLVKTDPDPRVRRRAQAVLLVAQGESVLGVARLFRTAPHRIRAWRDRYLERGRAGLADAPRPGRPPKLGAGERALLDEALQRGPQAYGWPVSTWSIRDLQALLRQHRQVAVSISTVDRAVRGAGLPRPPSATRLNASPGCGRRRRRAAGAGVAGKRAGAEPGAVHLVYLDECEVHRHPHLRRVWRRRGSVLRVPAAGEDARFAADGALDDASGQGIWQTAPTKDAATVVAFLDHLAAALPTGQILVVLDHVG